MIRSTQAKILALFVIIDLIASFIAALRTSTVVYAMISFFIGIVVFLIMILDQDCVVIGGCNIWGWVKMVITCIFLGIGILIAVVTAVKGKTIDMAETKESSDKKKENTENFYGISATNALLLRHTKKLR